MASVSEVLSPEQAEIFQFARNGHNLLLTGQAGTGKSRVVNAIRDDCRQRGLKVALICSSGIACQVYDRGVASTVHSYYGLGAADMPSEQLVDRATSNVSVFEKLKSADVVIWDEASMSSARMLELVNAVHHRLCEEETEEESFPFAGKQIIIVGEFLQLRPVPSSFDSGSFMFISRVFGYAITHRFQLTKVMRLSDNNTMFMNTLSDIRLGTCSEETALFIANLSRDLDPQLKRIATHIFFKKNSVLLFNRSTLEAIDGELVRFDATFEGKGDKMRWPGERSLFLKPDCKVMLVWNKSDCLINGSMGTFKRVDGDKLVVEFEKVGTVGVERVTWIQRNRQGAKIGSVSQFPLILGYAVTCHKSQGLELPAVILHSSREFVPGLVYVAMSRVRSAATLQVIGFNSSQILSADPEVIAQCSRDVGEYDASLRCCRKRLTIDESFFDVRDRFQLEDPEEVVEDGYQFPIEVEEGMVHAYFEREGVALRVSTAQIYRQMENHESELSRPPEDVDTRELLIPSKEETPCVSEFSRNVNETRDALLDARFSDNVKAFVNLMWFHSFLITEKHITENPDDLMVKVSRGDFTTATAKLNSLFRSPEFTEYILCLFNASTVTSAQRSVAVDISIAVYWKFLDYLLVLSAKETRQEVLVFDVEQMPAAGKAKIRHVGAWAIRKVLEKSRSYVRRNLYTENAQTMASVRRHHGISELIEESLVGSFSVLEHESQYKDTLQVTEARQYRERGLIHIEDLVFKFFMALEKERVSLLNDQALRSHGKKMVEVALQKLLNNAELKMKWMDCFATEDQEKKEELIDEIWESVIERYINMGTSQYLRDYRHSYELKKTAELRKRVLQRQTKKQEKTDSVPFKEILEDRSEGKTTSHERLLHFIQKHGDASVLARVYLKDQLISLCQAYEVNFRRSDTKKVLATTLVEGMRNKRTIPFIAPVDDRQFQVIETVADESIGSVRMTFRLSGNTETNSTN